MFWLFIHSTHQNWLKNSDSSSSSSGQENKTASSYLFNQLTLHVQTTAILTLVLVCFRLRARTVGPLDRTLVPLVRWFGLKASSNGPRRLNQVL